MDRIIRRKRFNSRELNELAIGDAEDAQFDPSTVPGAGFLGFNNCFLTSIAAEIEDPEGTDGFGPVDQGLAGPMHGPSPVLARQDEQPGEPFAAEWMHPYAGELVVSQGNVLPIRGAGHLHFEDTKSKTADSGFQVFGNSTGCPRFLELVWRTGDFIFAFTC